MFLREGLAGGRFLPWKELAGGWRPPDPGATGAGREVEREEHEHEIAAAAGRSRRGVVVVSSLVWDGLIGLATAAVSHLAQMCRIHVSKPIHI